jgi:cytochrome c oxidase assembly protein subunit 15
MSRTALVSAQVRAQIAPPMSQHARPIAVSNWLFFVAALVFLIVVVGGITRLTESGLSITEWRPVTGALPPLSAADWDEAFALYKATPEYQQINRGMSLADFKFIFFWEWFHRLLGRVIGLAFALPLAWFAVKRQIPSGYGWRLTLLLLLGGLQGVIGWWMVVSGLSLRTDVSHFRLAIHLMTALLILGLLVWTALDLRAGNRARLRVRPALVLLVLAVQILFGAWTAGLNAGLAASDWPLMNGRFFPEVAVNAQTLAYDPFLIHWVHRWWAWVTVAALVVLARMVRRTDRMASIALHTAFGTQILLGIATVMTEVNIILAVLHQAVGALVVASAAWAAHAAGRR